ncbi:unnamed protein product [Knipowitschia caucasica]|uniref:Uncharacterized protein n=1 Tax=Knipowitschia caucasica TaxID=637954 RepID=A0AAV2L9R7_KNICA
MMSLYHHQYLHAGICRTCPSCQSTAPEPRPLSLTDSQGRDLRLEGHGGVYVRVCGAVCRGEWVTEVPQRIVPFWGWSARCRGAVGTETCEVHSCCPFAPRCSWDRNVL